METHKVTIFGKKIQVTDKSIFRVEVRGDNKKPYDSVYSNRDVHKAVLYFNNTVVNHNHLVRLIKDGDEYVLLNKKQWYWTNFPYKVRVHKAHQIWLVGFVI